MVGLLVLLSAAAPAAAPPAVAAPLSGHDISWPQCPSSVGGFGLPLPPPETQFVVVGLTRGLPFTENPCLQSQVDWTRQNGKPAHGYTMAAFPTAAQLSTYGTQGPWSSRTRAGQLSNVGHAQARFALDSLRRVSFAPPVVWIDVEPRPAQPWPTATAAQHRENRLVLEGVMRGLRDAGVAYGLYSFLSGWNSITGSWWLPGVPVWATAGRLDTPTEAQEMCTRPSFSGGTVYLSQWYDDTRDYDMTCGSYGFTPLPVPPSSPSDATSDWDGDWTGDVLARAPASGDLLLYRGTGQGTLVGAGPVGAGWNGFDALDTVGDFDGDGALDVLAREAATGRLWLYPGDGRGGWRAWSVVGTGWDGMSALVGAGDLTGDQRVDVLAVERATGDLWLYPGNGRAGWLPRVRSGTGWGVMRSVLAPGDVDGDGRADVLAVDRAGGDLWLYPGNGQGGWLPRARVGTGWGVMDLLATAGDLTGDRAPDLLAREAATGVLWLYPGTGQGSWLPRSRIGADWNTLDAVS